MFNDFIKNTYALFWGLRVFLCVGNPAGALYHKFSRR